MPCHSFLKCLSLSLCLLSLPLPPSFPSLYFFLSSPFSPFWRCKPEPASMATHKRQNKHLLTNRDINVWKPSVFAVIPLGNITSCHPNSLPPHHYSSTCGQHFAARWRGSRNMWHHQQVTGHNTNRTFVIQALLCQFDVGWPSFTVSFLLGLQNCLLKMWPLGFH